MNKNQKIVLKYLKKQSELYTTPFASVWSVTNNCLRGFLPASVNKAYEELSHKEEYEVMKKFGKWGLKNEN